MKQFIMAACLGAMGAPTALAAGLDNWTPAARVPGLDLRSFALADITGDGREDLVILSRQEIRVYRFAAEGEGIESSPAVSYRGSVTDAFVNVDVIGTDPALLVSNVRNERARSLVLEYRHGKLEPAARDLPWLFNTVRGTGGEKLLGQKISGPRGLGQEVRAFAWDGSGRALKDSGAFAVPPGAAIFGLALLANQRAVLDGEGYLRVYGNGGGNGREIYRTGDRYGGSLNFFRKSLRDVFNVEQADRVFLAQDPAVLDASDREARLMVPKNISLFGGVIGRVQSYHKGRIILLKWKGGLIVEEASSKELGGYIADAVLKRRDGGWRLYVGLVTFSGALFQPAESQIIAFDLTDVAV